VAVVSSVDGRSVPWLDERGCVPWVGTSDTVPEVVTGSPVPRSGTDDNVRSDVTVLLAGSTVGRVSVVSPRGGAGEGSVPLTGSRVSPELLSASAISSNEGVNRKVTLLLTQYETRLASFLYVSK